MTGNSFPEWKSKTVRLCLAVTVAVFAMAAAKVSAADRLTTRSARVTHRGEVTAMTVSSVSIKTSGGVQEIPVSDILTINFDGEPPMLAQAQSNERSGDLESALQKYQSISKE
ncbi:MAG: hypothetical protein ACK58L_09890, partial [Planctomycetota bacterium]